jgi:acyl-CoA dehydrogenase
MNRSAPGHRDAIRELCAFPDEYFRNVDAQRAYPEAFVDALIGAGWLAAMIPEEYGGSGLGLTAASVIMEEINRCGGNACAVHGQMYNMGTLLRSGSAAQKQRYLPAIAAGTLRIQSMAVTEPTTGTDTTKIKTVAVRKGDRYVVNGQKVWISRVQHSDLMILLARTTPLADVKKKSEGMSVFIVDLRDAIGHGLTVRPIASADPETPPPAISTSVMMPRRSGACSSPAHSQRSRSRFALNPGPNAATSPWAPWGGAWRASHS